MRRTRNNARKSEEEIRGADIGNSGKGGIGIWEELGTTIGACKSVFLFPAVMLVFFLAFSVGTSENMVFFDSCRVDDVDFIVRSLSREP